ncbi:acyltransferase [Leucobacter sp. wl10]|uniref:acyltransferase family protein n=1 Tax=Leucobacter sp. wl10 TaxID=2304677 RepID=UPI0013C2A2B7|nr:acyltransferase [Leucobacter sp. wl10]
MNAPVSHRLRLDIQGLRALAVLLVIFAHALDFPSGGFIGVDVFFVISGFVITGLLLREHQRRGRISLKTFYIKRAKRIAPAAVLVITVTTIAGFALFSLDQFRSLWKDAVASTLFFANWRMAATGTDYFQQGLPPSPLQHYWSLSVEEQFYLIWPSR